MLLAAGAGALALLGWVRDGGEGTAVSGPVPVAAWEIKLAGPSLAYVPVGRSVLYVTKSDGSGSRVVARCGAADAGCVIRSPVWAPDGRRIAYLRGHLPRSSNRAGDLALYVVGRDGRGGRRLAECGGVDGACGLRWRSRLSWSPDSSQIAVSREGTISTVDAESARVRRLTNCGRGCFDVDPVWSPDGTTIAFLRVMWHEWAGEVHRVRVSRRRITSLAIYGRDPAWAPDGGAVLVATSEGTVTVGADGSQTLTAPRRRGDVAWSAWSPDGTRVLYFGALRGSRVNAVVVGTMRPNGTGRKRLYDGPCCVGPPVWSGDGERVAFSIRNPLPGNRVGTFVIDADGSRLRNLMRLSADELAWQPMSQARPEIGPRSSGG